MGACGAPEGGAAPGVGAARGGLHGLCAQQKRCTGRGSISEAEATDYHHEGEKDDDDDCPDAQRAHFLATLAASFV